MNDPATLVVKADPQAIKQTREFIGLVFGGWGLDDYVARTVVSELATNAVRHGSRLGDPVVIRAYLLDGRPVVEAWDTSDALPLPGPPDPTAEHGRGLLLVEALVSSWGTRPLGAGGKVVYAVLDAVPA